MSDEQIDPALDPALDPAMQLARKSFLLTVMGTVICIAAVIAWMM